MSGEPDYLVKARERLRRAEVEWAKHEPADRLDHGVLSGVRRKPNTRAENARHNRYLRASAAAVELEAAKTALAGAERAAKIAAHNAATQAAITPESLASATHVRTGFGWFHVTRVNAKTVTVDGDFGPLRVPIKQILEVRTVKP